MKLYPLEIVEQLTNTDKQACVSAVRILLAMAYMKPNILFMFSNEAAFHISGHVNKNNCVIWSTEYPKKILEHMRDSPKVNARCAVIKLRVIGPFLFKEQTVGGESYLAMLSAFMEENVPLAIFRREYF
ncbi:hypothetical protein Trydic_g16398 [Trypoxylus dichotomus]